MKADMIIIIMTQAILKVSSGDVDWLIVSKVIPSFKPSSLAKSVEAIPMALFGRRHMAAFALLESKKKVKRTQNKVGNRKLQPNMS